VSATSDTRDREYAERLIRLQTARWKRLLHVQAPYAWNLRKIRSGLVLEIGCGIGRNLMHLRRNDVGVDHNRFAVQYARSRGLKAFTPEEFERSEYNAPQVFDSLLLSHVAEHMSLGELVELLRKYRSVLKDGGRLIIICPQERGFASDATHVDFMDFEKIRRAASESGFEVYREFSFPFPRFMGRIFIYNEFVSLSTEASSLGAPDSSRRSDSARPPIL
jgi:SAM-dependent methyltransferase